MASGDPGAHDRRAIAHWLDGRLAGATTIEVGPLERPASGFSAETLIAPVSFTRDGHEATERLVVRKETPDPAIYPPKRPTSTWRCGSSTRSCARSRITPTCRWPRSLATNPT